VRLVTLHRIWSDGPSKFAFASWLSAVPDTNDEEGATLKTSVLGMVLSTALKNATLVTSGLQPEMKRRRYWICKSVASQNQL
jgi:hypothetical protein